MIRIFLLLYVYARDNLQRKKAAFRDSSRCAEPVGKLPVSRALIGWLIVELVQVFFSHARIADA